MNLYQKEKVKNQDDLFGKDMSNKLKIFKRLFSNVRGDSIVFVD